ncbi:hypothetical protein [Dyella sp.]|uniref:hypothetical protein n=1 Tax=Dyella sp. TaxID=1869338 RepID=UPI002D78FDD2|nr:hypothetical protein [Dyella sp.]HET7332563.1 hypothetical protein [Dyella sp.]
MQWVFETLGIDKQADVSTVRKAYAKAIKQCDQATEADRFQRIRHAYEFALQWAKQREAATPAVEQATQQPTDQPGRHAEPATTAPAPFAPPSPTHIAPFTVDDRISQPARHPLPARPVESARTSAKAVLDEFLAEARKPNVISISSLLGKYATDPRLTSLDAKAEFEQALLGRIFAGPVDISMLDAACDLFGWETSNRHLTQRPDLVQRMVRHQSLRHVLEASMPPPHEDLHWAMRTYTATQGQSGLSVQPWEVIKANRLLERFEAFKHELGERYSAEAFDWWRQKLIGNPTLLASYRESKAAPEAPPALPRRSQRATRGTGSGFLYIWPIIAILGAVAGHIPSTTPSYDPGTQTAPPPVHYLPSTMPSTQPQTDPFLMDIDALRRAAEQGDPTAQNYLGVRYENGAGVARDAPSAVEWFRRAADQGFPEAQYRLGQLYKIGNGVPQSTELALMWWQKAAAGGNALAQNNLAEAYAKGDGVKKDYLTARQWWEKAAFNNIPRAQASLGWLYENGYGVPTNINAAVDWYRKAAAQGDIAGQIGLALMYERGKGVPMDPVIAHALLTVAVDHQGLYVQDRLGSKDLDRIARTFTPAQRSASDQIARDLSASPARFLTTLDAATRFRHRM